MVSGCSYFQYHKTEPGQFGGKLEVRWLAPDKFMFVPVAGDPFYFIRKDGRRIQPEKMYTDGGSIPQLIWGVPGYSPWGYAPAYIIHDWVFVAHYCGTEPDASFSFDDSAMLIAEGIKTLMESKKVQKSSFTMYTIYEAVKSPVAEKLWKNGKCEPVVETLTRDFERSSKLITVIDMGQK